MKIDHLVLNIDKKYQTDSSTINDIKSNGFPYEPKWGKGTSGFKASNLWIGDEYFEMISLINENGGGWKKEWIEKYNKNHRGLICLFIDTNHINEEYNRLKKLNVEITVPEYLKFKWFFGLLTRTMPWQNAYLPFFKGAPFQLGFQQMKDEASKNWMQQYMIPNSKTHGIDKIVTINLYGDYTKTDKQLIFNIFPTAVQENNKIVVILPSEQKLFFIQDNIHHIEVFTRCLDEKLKGKEIKIHNLSIVNI